MEDGGLCATMKKRIVFIRHGESPRNALLKLLVEVFLTWKSFLCREKLVELPYALLAAVSLSSLTKLGCQQAAELRQHIEKTGLLSNTPNYTIVHSTLLRARQTATIIFRDHAMTSLACLREISVMEEMRGGTPKRLHDFEEWLRKSPHETIIMVGHCQYFRKLFHLGGHIYNCDMWSCDATIGSSAIRYNNIHLLHRCMLSYAHPLAFIFGSTTGSSNPSSDEEKCCRICHCSSLDSDEQLIKPCLCRGSQLYVHISCLNRWRSTSQSANYKCSVCHYSYRIQRTTISKVITSAFARNIATGMALLGVFGFLGILIRYGYDVAGILCTFGQIEMFWRKPRISFFRASFALPDELLTMLLCNNFARNVIESNMLGAEVAGGAFILHYVISLALNFRYNQTRVLQILAVNALFFATTNVKILCRLFILFGAVVACKSLFECVHKYSVYWSNKLGERILEVS